MKRLAVLLVLLVVPIVLAEVGDMYIEEGFVSPGNIYSNIHFYPGGNLYLNIDGMDYEQQVQQLQQQISESGFSMDYVFYRMYGLYWQKGYNDKWHKVNTSRIESYNGLLLRNVLDMQYMPREELINRLNDQQLLIMALQQKLNLTSDDLCKTKLSIAKLQGIKHFSCNGFDYDRIGNDFVIISSLPEPELEAPIIQERIIAKPNRTEARERALQNLCKNNAKYCSSVSVEAQVMLNITEESD